MKTLNPTMNLTQRMTHKALMLLALVLLMSGALACGDSAAVYAVRDEPGAMMGDDDNNKPDGKGDMPVEPDPKPVVPTAPSENVALSRATLEFIGEGYEAFITLESNAQVVEAFEQGAVVCGHDTPMAGIVLSWDGEATDIYVRRRDGNVVTPWQLVTEELANGGSFRGRAAFDDPMSQLDIYIADPSAVDFLTIEPIAPM